MTLSYVNIKNEKQRVVLSQGKACIEFPWQEAERVIAAIHLAKNAAEHIHRLENPQLRKDLYDDQQILVSAGIPINLGVPDPELRSMGCAQPTKIGLPRIIHHDRTAP